MDHSHSEAWKHNEEANGIIKARLWCYLKEDLQNRFTQHWGIYKSAHIQGRVDEDAQEQNRIHAGKLILWSSNWCCVLVMVTHWHFSSVDVLESSAMTYFVIRWRVNKNSNNMNNIEFIKCLLFMHAVKCSKIQDESKLGTSRFQKVITSELWRLSGEKVSTSLLRMILMMLLEGRCSMKFNSIEFY